MVLVPPGIGQTNPKVSSKLFMKQSPEYNIQIAINEVGQRSGGFAPTRIESDGFVKLEASQKKLGSQPLFYWELKSWGEEFVTHCHVVIQNFFQVWVVKFQC